MESPLSFSGKFFPKRAKNDVYLHYIRLKMGQKGYIIDQKGLKMHEKRQTPPPLNGQSLCSKKLSGKGGYPPLNGNNPLSSF